MESDYLRLVEQDDRADGVGGEDEDEDIFSRSPNYLRNDTINSHYYTKPKGPFLHRLKLRLKRHWNSLRTPMNEEGLDFMQNQDEIYSERMKELTPAKLRQQNVLRWVIGATIAIFVSICAILVDLTIHRITEFKFDSIKNYILKRHQQGDGRGKIYGADGFAIFGLYFGISLLFVFCASLIVAFLDVKAKGSGVPEIKSYLNGRKIHRVISIRTLMSKLFGVVLAVGGGLIVGKEGPMIHAGAVLGAVISQGRAEEHRIGWSSIIEFRNDREKRSFVSIGCACGVASAFSSPLGGVLFVIEEAASYWSVSLTWLTFFACICCVALVNVVLSGLKDTAEWGLMSQSAVVSFGSFEGASKESCYPEQPQYRVMQIPIFLFMGALGGCAGSLFIHLNIRLSKWRQSQVTTPGYRLAEALTVGIVTSTLLFMLIWTYPCRAIISASWVMNDGVSKQSRLNTTCDGMFPQGYFCVDNHRHSGFTDAAQHLVYFNDMETLIFKPLDESVRHLFHSEMLFQYMSLLLYGTAMFALACFTYGTGVPSGLFVPIIAVGASFGRIVGQILYELPLDTSSSLGQIDPGTYALIGAAALLGGVTRMTISIVVILLETTNNITYAIPIMITIMTAKLVGDTFNHGIYDEHINLQKIKFLHDDPMVEHSFLQVKDKMVRRPVTLKLLSNVATILEVLEDTTHNGFPVVSSIYSSHSNRSPRGSHFSRDNSLNTSNLDGKASWRSHGGLDSELLAVDGLDLNSSSNSNGNATRHVKRPTHRMRANRSLHSNSISSGSKHSVMYHSKGVFEGTVMRSQLCIALWEKAFETEAEFNILSKSGKKARAMSWKDFYKHYPRCPTVRDVKERLKSEDLEKILDLRPYLNTGALTVHYSIRFSRVHLLFRALGLRHLTIVDSANHVVGIVTRDQLVSAGTNAGDTEGKQETEDFPYPGDSFDAGEFEAEGGFISGDEELDEERNPRLEESFHSNPFEQTI